LIRLSDFYCLYKLRTLSDSISQVSNARPGPSTYDNLNRVATGTATDGYYAGAAMSWSYDAFGNRKSESVGGTVSAPMPSPSAASYTAATNQVASVNGGAGLVYDAAGDVTYDGQNQYLYDGEGRICAVASTPVPNMTTMTGYLYDAGGTRVAKGRITAWSCDPAVNGFQTTNDYILGLGGEQAAEMGVGTASSANPTSDSNSALTWQHTNVYAAGTLIATYDNDGLHFYFNDPLPGSPATGLRRWGGLGTRRAQTDYAGVLEQTCQSLPFGDGLSCSGGNLNACASRKSSGYSAG
jgi:hypothetical protein